MSQLSGIGSFSKSIGSRTKFGHPSSRHLRQPASSSSTSSMNEAASCASGPVRLRISITRSRASMTSSSTTCSLNFSVVIASRKKAVWIKICRRKL